MDIHSFDTLPSTNQYCELLDLDKVGEFSVYWAHAQTNGIGQRGNCWHSEAGKNLTFSVVLKPTFVAFEEQYQLTKALALGVSDYLSEQLTSHCVQIKWPNDIYVDGRKICGILTSNRIQGGRLTASVCGIGLNVNQTLFPDWIPNPTSMALAMGRTFNLEETLPGVIQCIESRYRQLASGTEEAIDMDYLDRLYQLNKMAQYLYLGKSIRAQITGVNRYGHLQLTTDQGESISCMMKEIAFEQSV